MEIVSISISVIALFISVLTLWDSRLKKGTIKMTKPSMIYFGPDGKSSSVSKITIRTLLYSTSERGQYVENMHIKLTHGEATQNFNIWVYGDPGNVLRGSGLFVGKQGLAVYHHFLLPNEHSNYLFEAGQYRVEVYTTLVGQKPVRIYDNNFEIDRPHAMEMSKEKRGLYFDWAPNVQSYYPHVDKKDEEKPYINSISRT